jgi:nitroreductase
MNVFDAMLRRYSYRGALDSAPIPEADLTKILEAAIYAPSGCNAQTTHFVIISNKEMLAKIAPYYGMELIKSAPVLIIVMTRKVTFDFGLDFEVEDYSAAVQNILLAVTALGYASCWMDGTTRLNGADVLISELLELEPEWTVRTILPIGKPVGEEGKPAPRKPFDERVIWKR